jgi:hypothetical protein
LRGYLACENPDDIRMRLKIAAWVLNIDLDALGEMIMILDIRAKPEAVHAELSRLVDPITHAPLTDWVPFPTVISQWVRESGAVVVSLAYEARGYFMQNGVPSPFSPSSFITIV